MMTTETIYLLLPELSLLVFAVLIFVSGAFLPGRAGWSWLGAAGLLASMGILYGQLRAEPLRTSVYGDGVSSLVQTGPVLIDQLAVASRMLVLMLGALFVMLTARTAARSQEAEFVGCLLLIVCGLNVVSMAGDLVLMFLGLELVSIPTYVLLFLGSGHSGRYAPQRQESATKYFFLSVLSSAMLLYGFSFLYGVAGSTELADLFDVLWKGQGTVAGSSLFAKLGMVLVFAGLGFRMTVVPFHFYAPDVYQGVTNPNAGLLSIVPKVAGLLVLVRIAVLAMPGLEKIGWQLTLAISVVTMTLGNVLALWQNNVRRLLAYSSIAHAGYILIGLAVAYAVAGGATGDDWGDGVGAALFYLLVYSLATAGTFAAITYLGNDRGQIDDVEQLAGLSQSHPRVSAALAIFMFSLAGLPPLAGFWGKFGLLFAALGVDAQAENISAGLWPWFLGLTMVTVINAAIAAAYYLRIVATLYFRPALSQREADGGVGAAFATFLCAVLVLYMGIDPGLWQTGANRISKSSRATYRTVLASKPIPLPEDELPDGEGEFDDYEDDFAVTKFSSP